MATTRQREHILDAGAQVVTEKGLGGVTVRAVAAGAGVGMGTLRHYFPTQRDLHVAVAERVLDDRIQDFDIADTALPPEERLVRCVLQFLPEDESERHLVEVWFGLYRHAIDPGASSTAQGFLEVTTRRSHTRLTAWLEQLADEGAVEPHRIAESALLLSALLSGACLEILTPGSAMTIESARRAVIRSTHALIVGTAA